MIAQVSHQKRNAHAQTFTVEPPVARCVALFLPFADIWTHQRVVEQFAHIWSKDNEIHLIKCDGIRHGACPAHRALKLSDATSLIERRRICARCQVVAGLRSGLPSIDLGMFSAPEYDVPDNLQDLLNFTLHEHPFGRVSVYDYLLTSKKGPESLDHHDLAPITSAVKDALDIYHKFLSVLRLHQFDLLVVNNELYGLNAAAVAAARDCQVEVLNLDLGMFISELDRSILLTSNPDKYFYLGQNYRDESKTTPISNEFALALRQELRARYLKRHSLNYGGYKSRWHRFDNTDVRFRATLFLSSPDEMQTYHFVRGRKVGNLDQLDLLNNFIRYAELHPSESFCVRPHPRLEPNRRDLNRSPFAETLSNTLRDAPPNVTVDSGHAARPVVQTIRASDSIVVSWSSIGLDAAVLGIPVIFGLPDFPLMYPAGVGTTVADTTYDSFAYALKNVSETHDSEKLGAALDFLQYLWNSHLRLSFPSVRFSPSLALLWLDSKIFCQISPRLHRALRKVELAVSAKLFGEWAQSCTAARYALCAKKIALKGGPLTSRNRGLILSSQLRAELLIDANSRR